MLTISNAKTLSSRAKQRFIYICHSLERYLRRWRGFHSGQFALIGRIVKSFDSVNTICKSMRTTCSQLYIIKLSKGIPVLRSSRSLSYYICEEPSLFLHYQDLALLLMFFILSYEEAMPLLQYMQNLTVSL
jgi:hypothetical protein